MALVPALIITGIAIALLVVYAADVAVVEITGNKEGFIPFDHKIRGMGLGLPALILPILAYFISRKDSSKGLGIMIIISGGLIIFGGLFVMANADLVVAKETGRNVMSETAPLLIAGAIQIGLGILKIKKS
jgi:hypothetical protein